MFKKFKRITMSFIAVLLFITVFSVATEVNATGEESATVFDLDENSISSGYKAQSPRFVNGDESYTFDATIATKNSGLILGSNKNVSYDSDFENVYIGSKGGVSLKSQKAISFTEFSFIVEDGSGKDYVFQLLYKEEGGSWVEFGEKTSFDNGAITSPTPLTISFDSVKTAYVALCETGENDEPRCKLNSISIVSAPAIPKVNVTFLDSFSTESIDAVEIDENGYLLASDLPTASFELGKVFEFWALSTDLTKEFDYANTPITEDISLEAVYRQASPMEIQDSLIEQFQLLHTQAKLGLSYHFSREESIYSTNTALVPDGYGNFNGSQNNIASLLGLDETIFSVTGEKASTYGPSYGTNTKSQILLDTNDALKITSIKEIYKIEFDLNLLNDSTVLTITNENGSLIGTIDSSVTTFDLTVCEPSKVLKITSNSDDSYILPMKITLGKTSFDKQHAELGFINRDISDAMLNIEGATFGIAYIKGDHIFTSEEGVISEANYLALTPGDALDDNGNIIAGMHQIGLRLQYRAEGEELDRKTKYKDLYSVAVYMELDGIKYFMVTKTTSIKEISKEYMNSKDKNIENACKEHKGILTSLKNLE